MKLAYTHALGACSARSEGSSPSSSTKHKHYFMAQPSVKEIRENFLLGLRKLSPEYFAKLLERVSRKSPECESLLRSLYGGAELTPHSWNILLPVLRDSFDERIGEIRSSSSWQKSLSEDDLLSDSRRYDLSAEFRGGRKPNLDFYDEVLRPDSGPDSHTFGKFPGRHS